MRTKLFSILGLFILAPVSSQAENWIKQGDETLTFGLGVFLQAFDTTLRVDNQTVGAGGDGEVADRGFP